MTAYPILIYDDAHAAIDFLGRAFGYERLNVFENDDGKVVHAELRKGNDFVMLSERGAGDPMFDPGQTAVYVVADDIDGIHDQAKAAGAEILLEPTDQDYGSRDFAAKDPEGNIWAFGTYAPGGE
jgi:uncharacterized glyoxalase superfamily protein PhnB